MTEQIFTEKEKEFDVSVRRASHMSIQTESDVECYSRDFPAHFSLSINLGKRMWAAIFLAAEHPPQGSTQCTTLVIFTNIDRKKYGKRVTPMKVLMLGMGRTGTESISNALRLLGINECYHGWQALFNNPRDNEMWLEAIEAKFDGIGKTFGKAEFDKLLGHCQGVSDMPAILFADELIAAYPDAKVILTHRNFDTWYRSALETCEKRFAHPLTKGLIPVGYALMMHSRWTRPAFKRSWEILFDGDFMNNARTGYDRHYDHVRSLVPPERLLEYNVKEGWAPLCEFLDVPHPKIDFPNGNEAVVLNRRFEAALKLTLMAIVQRVGLIALVAGASAYAVLLMYQRT
ncbi:hypothetical protein LTR08_008451 [Meristemomyces frigidus]|nr:hypothetical protein LTR08_008451 [Meristemomyces frigidus]